LTFDAISEDAGQQTFSTPSTMPKKQQLTPATAEHVLDDLDRTRMSLFGAMQTLNRYYRKDDGLVRRAASFYHNFVDFRGECERQFKAKLHR